AQGKTFDALRCPVGGNFLAAHPPDFFGVAFKENIKETPSELVGHPILEIAGIAHGQKPRFEPGKEAKGRLDNAQLDERFEWFQREGEKLVYINYARCWRQAQHVIGQI